MQIYEKQEAHNWTTRTELLELSTSERTKSSINTFRPVIHAITGIVDSIYIFMYPRLTSRFHFVEIAKLQGKWSPLVFPGPWRKFVLFKEIITEEWGSILLKEGQTPTMPDPEKKAEGNFTKSGINHEDWKSFESAPGFSRDLPRKRWNS